MEVKEKIKEITELQKKIEATKADVIRALFRSIPNLKVINLSSEQEYDDNNYQLVTRVKKINGHRIDDLSNLEYGLEHVDAESDEYRAVLVEMDLKDHEVEAIVDTLQALGPLYLECYEVLDRKEYLGEAK